MHFFSIQGTPSWLSYFSFDKLRLIPFLLLFLYLRRWRSGILQKRLQRRGVCSAFQFHRGIWITEAASVLVSFFPVSVFYIFPVFTQHIIFHFTWSCFGFSVFSFRAPGNLAIVLIVSCIFFPSSSILGFAYLVSVPKAVNLSQINRHSSSSSICAQVFCAFPLCLPSLVHSVTKAAACLAPFS